MSIIKIFSGDRSAPSSNTVTPGSPDLLAEAEKLPVTPKGARNSPHQSFDGKKSTLFNSSPQVSMRAGK